MSGMGGHFCCVSLPEKPGSGTGYMGRAAQQEVQVVGAASPSGEEASQLSPVVLCTGLEVLGLTESKRCRTVFPGYKYRFTFNSTA